MYPVISMPFVSLILATFLSAELGFFRSGGINPHANPPFLGTSLKSSGLAFLLDRLSSLAEQLTYRRHKNILSRNLGNPIIISLIMDQCQMGELKKNAKDPNQGKDYLTERK